MPRSGFGVRLGWPPRLPRAHPEACADPPCVLCIVCIVRGVGSGLAKGRSG